jgi:hypothetical protein
MKNQDKPKMAMKKTVTKSVVKPAEKSPVKVAVKTNKTVIQPKAKMMKAPLNKEYKMDYFGKKADSLAESGVKKSLKGNFSGSDKDFNEAKKMMGNAKGELEKYKSDIKKYINNHSSKK